MCTSVILHLARNNKIMSMFVPFSSCLGHLEFLVFLRKWGGGGGQKLTPKQSNRMSLVNFSKVQQK